MQARHYRTEAPWMALQLLLASQSGIHLMPDIRIQAQQSLVLSEGQYASIQFQAEQISQRKEQVPVPYRFELSGELPPGMFFESYPCHKPGEKNFPALAATDSMYIDGVPERSGSYKVKIRASKPDGEAAAKEFTITVKPGR